MPNFGSECSHTEQATALGLVFVTLVRVLRLIEPAWVVVVIGGLVHALLTARMIAVGQTMSGPVSRRKCHGYGRRHEGEHSEGGHSKSYAKLDAPSQCCQHAAELAIFAPVAFYSAHAKWQPPAEHMCFIR